MNKEEIMALKPGRDLDIKIALAVMGYVWITHIIHFSEEMTVKWLGTQADIDKAGGAYVAVRPEKVYALKLREDFAEAVPHYSTDAAAAAQVAERIRQSGRAVRPDTKPADICREALLAMQSQE